MLTIGHSASQVVNQRYRDENIGDSNEPSKRKIFRRHWSAKKEKATYPAEMSQIVTPQFQEAKRETLNSLSKSGKSNKIFYDLLNIYVHSPLKTKILIVAPIPKPAVNS